MNIIRYLNILFGLFGLSCLVTFPLSFYFFTRKELDTAHTYDERSGKGDQSVVPEEIQRWNWAAAFLSIFWGPSHRVWISLLAFVPLVNLFWWIVMGKYGNKWAWQSEPWESVEDFQAIQRRWRPWGIAVFIIGMLSAVFWFWVQFLLFL